MTDGNIKVIAQDGYADGISNAASLTILGGHITAVSEYEGNASGTGIVNGASDNNMVIGDKDTELNTENLTIVGNDVGIQANYEWGGFYNGIIKGGKAACTGNEPTAVRAGYRVANGTEVIDGVTYQTAYLEENVFEEQGTINGEPGSYQNPTIPAGYIPIDTEDAKWTGENGPEWNNGLVIADSAENGNEWVWVPVEDPSIMYEENTAGVALSGSTGVTTTKYSASGVISGSYGTRGLPGSTSYREPDLVTDYDNDSRAQTAGFSSLSNMANTMVSEYSTMIDSVSKYGGFYIGRYELTANGTKPGTVLTNTNWYTLYKNCTTLSKSGSNSMSRMIWGAQWDVTCLWLEQNDYDINDSTSYGNYYNVDVYSSDGSSIIKPSGTEQKLETGITTFTRANNVYDLAGNCMEWTQEARYTYYRYFRGGTYSDYGSSSPVTDRFSYNVPTHGYSDYASRPTLILNP